MSPATEIQTKGKEYFLRYCLDALADAWMEAVKKTSYLSLPQPRLNWFFKKLAEQCIEAIFEETEQNREAKGVKIGASLAQLHYLQPEALGETQKVLWQSLLTVPPPFEIYTLHTAIADVIGGISVGFFRETRREMLLSQENIHNAVRVALLASEQKFQRLTEIIFAAIFIYQGTQLKYVNKWFKLVTGYSDEEIQQMNFWDIVHPDHREMALQRGLARQQGEFPPARYELKIQRKDGQTLWVELSTALIEFEGNNAVLGTAFDITDRVLNAERYQKLLKQVTVVEERQRVLLSAIPDLVFRLDMQGKIIDYHTNDPEILYVPPEVFMGKSFNETLASPTGDQLHTVVLEVAHTGEPQQIEYTLEVGGRHRYFEAHIICGQLEVLAAIRDVTGRKLAERGMIRSERMAALGHLAAALAHELNNPLQAIQTNLDLVLDFPLSPQEKEETLKVVRVELERVNELSQNILSFASPRPDARQTMMVTDVLIHVLRLWRNHLEQAAIRVETKFNPIPPIIAAEHQLHQVFLNLILNAIDAIHSRAESGTITITVDNDGDAVDVCFFNDGPPISASEHPHLYSTRA